MSFLDAGQDVRDLALGYPDRRDKTGGERVAL